MKKTAFIIFFSVLIASSVSASPLGDAIVTPFFYCNLDYDVILFILVLLSILFYSFIQINNILNEQNNVDEKELL